MTKLIYVLILMLSFNACGKSIKDVTHDRLTETHTRQVRTYKEARTILFGELHYNNGIVTDVYCDEEYDAEYGVGKGRIPDPKFLNCEHTWPQSKFLSAQAETMKTDLHHLYPTNSRANSTRSNNPFAKIGRGTHVCGTSYTGKVNGVTSFEPPDSHKGNVARAMFYFSVRYEMPIDPAQESVLRQWHMLDPVDSFEIWRNKRIMQVQGNSNIFIDDPSLVQTIDDF